MTANYWETFSYLEIHSALCDQKGLFYLAVCNSNSLLEQWFIQLACLDDWAVLEKCHIAALSGAVENLEGNTLRLPVTGRGRVS